MSRVFIGIDNWVRSGTLSASAAAAGMPAANMANDQGSPDAGWQTPAGVVTAAAGAAFVCDFGSLRACRVVAIARTNLMPAAAVTFTLLAGSAVVWTATLAGPVPRFGQVVAVLPAEVQATRLQVQIDDPTNKDRFINVPLCHVGPAWSPVVGLTWDTAFDRDDQVADRTSAGGQEFPEQRYARRKFQLHLGGVTEAEHWAWLDYLDHVARTRANILVIPNGASPFLGREAILGIVRPTAAVTFPGGASDARGWAATVSERI